MRILILANARYSGGLSGSDAIYESFLKYWPEDITARTMMDIDYKPFFVCYIHRIVKAYWHAITDRNKYDMVYSASDFMMDVIPALVYQAKGSKWVAGFFLKAQKYNHLHRISQLFCRRWIEKFSDMVIVTNPTMFYLFPNKKLTWINGGIEEKYLNFSKEEKIYDIVFCGRLHKTKGLENILSLWPLIKNSNPKARMAIIGDGDLGIQYYKNLISSVMAFQSSDIDFLGFMGEERFEIYRKSKFVIYPTSIEHDHFSMAPLEAMACGCPMFCFCLNTVKSIAGWNKGIIYCDNLIDMANKIIRAIQYYDKNEIAFEYAGESMTMFESSIEAFELSKRFKYKEQSMRVYNDIRGLANENIDNGRAGNGWDSLMRGIKSA